MTTTPDRQPWNSSAANLVRHQEHRRPVAEWCPPADETARTDEPTPLNVLTDLRDRCQRAVDALAREEDDTAGDGPVDAHRRARLDLLAGERSGVKLALSYIDETIRGLS